MDITQLSMDMSLINIQNSAQVSIMKMTMENSSVISEQMTEMMDNMAVDTNLGVDFDYKV